MALAVLTRPMPRAITAWCVQRLYSRVSDRMARSAMTPAEPHVQPATCDPTQGGELFDPASDGGTAHLRVASRALLFFGHTTGAGCTRGRSALSRLFHGGKGLGQHAFGVASPLVELGLGGILHRWGEFFNIPHFRHARAGTAGLQTVGPAHIWAFVGARHEFEVPAALGHGDLHWHRPRTLAGPGVAEIGRASRRGRVRRRRVAG